VVILLGWLVGSGLLVRVGGFLSRTWLFRFRAGLAPRRLSALWFPGLFFWFFSWRHSCFLGLSGFACGKIGSLVRFFVGIPRLAGFLVVLFVRRVPFYPRVCVGKTGPTLLAADKWDSPASEIGLTVELVPSKRLVLVPPTCG
jgi:hypothetical protein